ncbi:V-set domain-containing T-cell activation inhibitor 1-like isoform X2 [Labeo rohita]|uniref:V-set domain-containing T-cell activation inhibitor 1-like isoform X2 n=1 Tax=Labeo rohita TaxID=84645 RepID=UPI0021E31976|nr:V-set domain-containing T-cell activation inhibitor 1-like isoform X2 [Labeo rohita]
MKFSCCFICVFTVLINKVCLEVTIVAVTGGSVILPCSSAKHSHELQDINVHWRHSGSTIVYDITKGKDLIAKQDQRFKNRAETFPDEYVRGNFSIRLINLTDADAGKYICYITHSDEWEIVQLIINGTKSTVQEDQGTDTGAGSVRTSLFWTDVRRAQLTSA